MHPKSLYRIEQRCHKYWYIVERATTRRGFTKGKENRVVLACYRDKAKAVIGLGLLKNNY